MSSSVSLERLPVTPGRVLDGNAQTRRDFCRYYLLVGAESIEYALAVQADRLDFPISAMNEARLDANRDIVLNEYRGNESRSFGFGSTTDVKMLVNTYGPQHPYGRPIQINGDVSCRAHHVLEEMGLAPVARNFVA
jgi:predicted Zn-dependent peptidase